MENYCADHTEIVQAVAQWLQLSAACPISLSVSDWANDWGRDSVLLSETALINETALIKSLAAFSDRWSHVEFMQFSSESARKLAVISPPLESFKFTGDIPVLRQLDIFKAQSLRTVIIHSQGLDGLDEFIDVPLAWNQLTHLTLCSGHDGRLSFDNVITLLGRCPRLVSFCATPKEADHRFDSVSELISLPFLEIFNMPGPNLLSLRAINRLVERVSMPRLRQFHVAAVPSEGPNSFFLIPLGKLSPGIENLTIDLPSLTTQSLPETLRSFSSLTKLQVFSPDNWGRTLDPAFQPCDLAQFWSS
ncbi:hypothetical protein B0H19DRAFT_368283 [Mycena capillaripes]|nr:hypothetical protein B0H19DRAFT_368283 [Mycena capillaripes]